ncbi:MAG: histidinol dehydrogenase [Geminicoccaceae bacterium]
MSRRFSLHDSDFDARFAAFLAEDRDPQADVRDVVAQIIADVRSHGDAALLAHTRRLDRVKAEQIEALRVPFSEIEAARARCGQAELAALSVAAERISAFHQAQLPQDLQFDDDRGVGLGLRWRPIDSVGLYVPGGTAAYPSSLLMNALPAQVAGCKRLVMVTPTPDGQLNDLVLAAASLLGIGEIWRIGGAQAVAALTYGTAHVAPVDKIVGPGNAYVAEAKRQVFGKVGIDMIAGPSEILVIADGRNDPDWIAADLLSQAEHDAVAQSILITDDADFATAVSAAVQRLLPELPRHNIAASAWRDHGAIIVVDDVMRDAPALANRIAAEHLQICVTDSEALAAEIDHAGAIFLGAWTPEVIGDYVGGPNHVLPTNRSARFSSGLSVFDFMKRSTLLRCDAGNFAPLGQAAAALAHAEGLQAHALAVEKRLARLAGDGT